MYRQLLRCFRGGLLLALLLNWGKAQGAESPAALMEKYGLSPGMKITKDNADLIKDLVPDAVYQRTKSGDFVFQIGKLDPPDILAKGWFPEFYGATRRNRGKYDWTPEQGIIDKATGKRPWPMPLGYPFPEIDTTEDAAKVGAKINWNFFVTSAPPSTTELVGWIFSVPFRGGPDRVLNNRTVKLYTEFTQNPISVNEPTSYRQIDFFLEPTDAFGTAILTWRWAAADKWDSTWSYVPALRRIRRVTAANRSDGLFGTEAHSDIVDLFKGKIEMFDWRFIEERAMLMPFYRLASQAPDDYIVRAVVQGKPSSHYPHDPNAFESEDWYQWTNPWKNPGQEIASWWNPDYLWVVVPAYVVEGIPKDPYYNFGRYILWFEVESFSLVWNESFNRAGERWRTASQPSAFIRYDGGGKVTGILDQTTWFLFDELSNRGASMIESASSDGGRSYKSQYGMGLPSDLFTLSGFLQYGK